MEIARMNERITIEKNTVVVDKIGNHVNTWEEYFSCYTYASTYEAQESGDEVTEEKLLTNLRQMTDKTVLIITHRAAALRICDRKIEMTPVSV